MKETIREIMNQFNKGKITQGLICIGDINQILSVFQETSENEIVLFDSNPETVLEFIFEQYGQPLPIDKKISINSSIRIKQGERNIKDVSKEFFKAFKSQKNDQNKIIVVSSLDEYVEIFPDLFITLSSVIKDLKGKKIRTFLALQFKKQESYEKLKNLFEKIDVIEFENIFSSKIVQSSNKSRPQTLELDSENSGEIPKETIGKTNEFKNKVLRAMTVFDEPEILKSSTEPEKLEKSINLFKSYVMELQAEVDSDQPPNMNIIYKLDSLHQILINAQPLLIKKLLEPLDQLLQGYFNNGVSTIGSIIPIARIIYSFMLLAEDKKKRYQFVKLIAEKMQLFDRIDYAVEFYHLALAISKSKQDAEITSKYYTQLAEDETGYLARTYYYKALASAYITEEKITIDQLTVKTEQTYKYKPSFPMF
jgi:hypothetical protein